jgi:hypothetical protein
MSGGRSQGESGHEAVLRLTQTWRTDSKSATVGRRMSLKAFRAVCVDDSSLS